MLAISEFRPGQHSEKQHGSWALTTWAGALADERPDLLDKIVVEMVKAKGVKSSQQHLDGAQRFCHMDIEHGVLLHRMKGNTHPWRGTWGSPFGMLLP